MKKIIIIIMAVTIMFSCEKSVVLEDSGDDNNSTVVSSPSKKFIFTVKGDFDNATFTRSYLAAEGQEMTDLWAFDYVDGVLIQYVHQSAGDAEWGQPNMSLSYGSHHIYFVVSRGEGATLDIDGHTIIWSGPRDTFWKDYQVDVVSTSNGNRAVTLDRVATKIRIVINDEIPVSCKELTVIPERWYYGWDFVNGVSVASQQTERTVSVTEPYIGTSGQMALSIYGLSNPNEWVTNILLEAKDTNGNVLGSANITGAPFKQNRSTEYSGNLFGSTNGFNVSLSSTWEKPHIETW